MTIGVQQLISTISESHGNETDETRVRPSAVCLDQYIFDDTTNSNKY